MTYVLNFTNPYTTLIGLLFALVLIILGKEFKKSVLPAIGLLLFLTSILVHVFQSITITDILLKAIATKSIIVDALLIFLLYISYMWIDDMEAKHKNKKSIDNSLEWFWKQV